jgi:hypothetical protein
MMSFASPSFFYFPLISINIQIITKISHKENDEQNLIRCSKEEFTEISLNSKLKNIQINLDLPEIFESNIKSVTYHLGTLNMTNFMNYLLVSHLIQVQVTAYLNSTYAKLAEVMI